MRQLVSYIYNKGKFNYVCANDVHRIPSVKDAMMIPMSSEAIEQLAKPPQSGFFALRVVGKKSTECQ